MAYEIEKGIALPEDKRGRYPRSGGSKYPLADMSVGDSFFVPYPDGKAIKNSQGQDALRVAINSTANKQRHKQPGRRYTVRPVDGGVRCWRVE